jgi:hypothetical protein
MISIQKLLARTLTGLAAENLAPVTADIEVTAEANKDWDYKTPTAIKIFNMNKAKADFGFSACREVANAIVTSVPEGHDYISSIEVMEAPVTEKQNRNKKKKKGKQDEGPPDPPCFINITAKTEFLEA